VDHRESQNRVNHSLIKNTNKMQDLFEYPEIWPANLRAILARYMAKEQTYTNLIQLENDLLKIGYSIEYGLDCMAYNLNKINK
jgi:hypothetical protein